MQPDVNDIINRLVAENANLLRRAVIAESLVAQHEAASSEKETE